VQVLAGVGGRASPRANLAEASVCVAVEALARESSRRGGEVLPVPREPALADARPELSR
jgi:hypothetical protein